VFDGPSSSPTRFPDEHLRQRRPTPLTERGPSAGGRRAAGAARSSRRAATRRAAGRRAGALRWRSPRTSAARRLKAGPAASSSACCHRPRARLGGRTRKVLAASTSPCSALEIRSRPRRSRKLIVGLRESVAIRDRPRTTLQQGIPPSPDHRRPSWHLRRARSSTGRASRSSGGPLQQAHARTYVQRGVSV